MYLLISRYLSTEVRQIIMQITCAGSARNVYLTGSVQSVNKFSLFELSITHQHEAAKRNGTKLNYKSIFFLFNKSN